MNLGFPLKTTQSFDLSQAFKAGIEKYPGPSFFPPVSGFFSNLNTLRAELDYPKYMKMIQADSRLSEELEGKILKYLSFALILDVKFKFETNYPKSIYTPFTWTDSFDQNNKVQLSSMKFEIVCHLYNLALCEFIIGSSLILMPEDSDKKIALRRFRFGIWAIKEIKTILPSVNFNAMQKNQGMADLTLQNLSVLESFFLGLSYYALFEIHEKSEITLGYNNIAAIIYAASKNFKLARGIIEQNKPLFPADLGKKLSGFLNFYEAYTEGVSCLKMAKNHESLIQDQPNGQHMGFALSYARKGNAAVDTILKNNSDLAMMPANLQQKLRSISDTLKTTLQTFEKKNNQIYKHREFLINELPGAPEISQKLIIGPIVPEIFQKSVSEEGLFTSFVSEELEKEMQDIRGMVEEFKTNVRNQVNQFKDFKNEKFSANSINFITNFSQSQMGKKEIPSGIKVKLAEFVMKGGSTKVKQLHKNLIERCLQSDNIVKEIRRKLQSEANEEKKYKDMYQHLWTVTSSDVLNYEYYEFLNDLLGKFIQAQSVDEITLNKYSKNKENIELFAKGEEGILQIIPSSVDPYFFQNNNQVIMQLKDKVDNVEKITAKNDQLFNTFNDCFANMNLDQKIMEAKQKSAIPNQIAQMVLSTVYPLVGEITENIKAGQLLIDSIVLESSSLRNKMMSSSVNAKVLEDINLALQEVTQILEELSKGGTFYESLLAYLQNLNQTVDDYVMARQAQFVDLIEKIDHMIPKKPPSVYQKPSQMPQPSKFEKPEEKKMDIEPKEPKSFFDEESNRFPLGCSVFVPNRKTNNNLAESIVNVYESTVVQNLSDSRVKK